MAPNGHGASRRSDVQQSQATQHQSWLDQFGHSEYQNWRNGNPTKHLSYDDWKTSQHVDGLSLYYATLQIFEESDSSVCYIVPIAASVLRLIEIGRRD